MTTGDQDTKEPEAMDWLESAESKRITESIRASLLPIVRAVAQTVSGNPRAAIDLVRHALDEMAVSAAKDADLEASRA